MALKHKAFRLFLIALISSLSIMLFVGCGAPSEEVDESTVNGETTADPDSEVKIVRFTLANTPYLDPAVGSDEATSATFVNLYDTLVFPNEDGTVSENIATEWEVSEDGLVWDFIIQPGITFHNGDEMTAEDVAFSMERLITVGEGYGYLFSGRVSSAEALDDYTVRFTLQDPYGPFLTSLVRLYIVNKDQVMQNIKEGQYGEFGDYAKDWFLTNDAGSGPYSVKEMKQGEYLTCKKYPDYWKGFHPNNPDEFKLIGLTEPVTIRTMMARQELEITDPYQPMENYDAMEQIEGIDVTTFFTGSLMSLTLNNQKPPTDDLQFRKAMAYVIDYDTLVDTVYPGSKKATSCVSFTVAGHNEDAFTYNYDPEKALEELKKSKYYDNLDQYPLELAWIAETPDREKIALLIQSDAAKIGITVNVVKLPWLSLVEGSTKPETTPGSATILTAPHYSEALSQLESRFRTKTVGSWEQCEWVMRDDIDAMIDDALATINVEDRLDKLELIQEVLLESVHTIPLFDQPEKHAYQSAYVEWDAAERASAGLPVTAVMGYQYNMLGIRVYPERIK